MNIRTMILDDDENSRLAARTALGEYPEMELVGEFEESGELFAFLEEHTAHVLFLDIELNEEMGFDVARRLKQTNPELLIVFLTGHSSYAVDGYDFQPVHFLTKPINKERLGQTVAEIRRRMGERREQSAAKLMFHLRQGYRIFDVRDICFIGRQGRKNFLHTETETVQIANYTMRELEEMLAVHGFFLCHQSYLLSLYRVATVQDVGRQLYEATLRNCDMPIPISRNRYEELLRQLKEIGVTAM